MLMSYLMRILVAVTDVLSRCRTVEDFVAYSAVVLVLSLAALTML